MGKPDSHKTTFRQRMLKLEIERHEISYPADANIAS